MAQHPRVQACWPALSRVPGLHSSRMASFPAPAWRHMTESPAPYRPIVPSPSAPQHPTGWPARKPLARTMPLHTDRATPSTASPMQCQVSPLAPRLLEIPTCPVSFPTSLQAAAPQVPAWHLHGCTLQPTASFSLPHVVAGYPLEASQGFGYKSHEMRRFKGFFFLAFFRVKKGRKLLRFVGYSREEVS